MHTYSYKDDKSTTLITRYLHVDTTLTEMMARLWCLVRCDYVQVIGSHNREHVELLFFLQDNQAKYVQHITNGGLYLSLVSCTIILFSEEYRESGDATLNKNVDLCDR